MDENSTRMEVGQTYKVPFTSGSNTFDVAITPIYLEPELTYTVDGAPGGPQCVFSYDTESGQLKSHPAMPDADLELKIADWIENQNA